MWEERQFSNYIQKCNTCYLNKSCHYIFVIKQKHNFYCYNSAMQLFHAQLTGECSMIKRPNQNLSFIKECPQFIWKYAHDHKYRDDIDLYKFFVFSYCKYILGHIRNVPMCCKGCNWIALQYCHIDTSHCRHMNINHTALGIIILTTSQPVVELPF